LEFGFGFESHTSEIIFERLFIDLDRFSAIAKPSLTTVNTFLAIEWKSEHIF